MKVVVRLKLLYTRKVGITKKRYFELINLTLIILTLNVGCKPSNHRNEGVDTNQIVLDQKVVLFDMDPISCLSMNENMNYVIIFYFMGDCSECISKYISWNKEIKKTTWVEKAKILEIAKGSEYETLLYYMENFKIEPVNCLLKSSDDFESANSDVLKSNNGVTVLLLNDQNQVLVNGNPFNEDHILERYDQIL